jgi:hypothetical protein
MSWYKLGCLIVVLLFAADATRAIAAEGFGLYTGNSLWKECKSDPPSGVCLGYVSGIADAMIAKDEGVMGFHTCLRSHLPAGQLIDIVKLYLEKHPWRRAYGAGGLVADALEQAFPCSP